MAKKMCESFWEHPTKFIFWMFVSVTAFCVLVTYMPKWFNAIVGVVMIVLLIKGIKELEIQEENKQHVQRKTPIINYEKMYAEYGEMISRKINEMGLDETYIHQNWLKTFHEYFSKVTILCNNEKFTDFHIAACIIFSLVWYSDDIEYTEVIYKCVRGLISKPGVYKTRSIKGDKIILKLKQTLPRVNLRKIEEEISSKDIAKIIKKIYIKNKNEKALMEMADFLKRLYLSCTRD